MNFEIYECKKSIKELDVDINILQNKLNDLLSKKIFIQNKLDKLSNLYENFTIDTYNLECIKYLYNNIKYLDKSDIELSNINVLDNLETNILNNKRNYEIIKYAHKAHCVKNNIIFEEDYCNFDIKNFSIYFE